jgi:hypothetical protein
LLENIRASMTMLGEGVFALGEAAPTVLSSFGRVFQLRVAGGDSRMAR